MSSFSTTMALNLKHFLVKNAKNAKEVQNN